MSALEDRQRLIRDIEAARVAGARLAPACAVAGIDPRTFQRWQTDGEVRPDRRPEVERKRPAHALSETERAEILRVVNEPRFAPLPPAHIVPRLADEGVYLASERTFYRVMRAADQVSHRGRAKPPQATRPPTTHVARAPGQVWCWDVTWLPRTVAGQWFYLYLILDLYSRKIVGWEIHQRESAEHAAALVRRAVLAEGARTPPRVLHADNGSAQKGSTLLATLQALGIAPSYSRPRVSDDNAFSEALFRTCKYRPDYPARGFADLDSARTWTLKFVRWYNEEHRHSALRFVTPTQRHRGEDAAILSAREQLYAQARARHPGRWSGPTRDWTPPGPVILNPRAADSEPALEQAA